MGKIRKILETELVGGTQSTDVYPVTSTKAVYDTNNKVLDDYIQHFKKTSTFAGIATPTTNPGTPDGPVFYLAAGPGVFSNFGITLSILECAVFLWNGVSWIKKTISFSTLEAFKRITSTGVYNLHGYIGLTGNFAPSNNYRATDFIPLSTNAPILINHAYAGNSSLIIAFYDEKRSFISGINNATSVNISVEDIPENAKYIRCGTSLDTAETAIIINISIDELGTQVVKLGTQIDELGTQIDESEIQVVKLETQVAKIRNLSPTLDLVGYYNLNGNLAATLNARNTGFILIAGYTKLEYQVDISESGLAVSFWNKDRKYIPSLSIPGAGLTSGTIDLTQSKYDDAEYIVISYYDITGAYSKYKCILSNENSLESRVAKLESKEFTPALLPSKDDKLSILIFGDSITDCASITIDSITNTTTAYSLRHPANSYTDSKGQLIRFDMWPYLITQYLNCFDLRNYAKSGASYKYSERETEDLKRQNLSYQIEVAINDINNPNGVFPTKGQFSPDIIIFALGTNDGSPNDTFDSAMAKTIMDEAGTSFDIEATLSNLDLSKFCEAARYAFLTIKKQFPYALCMCVLPIQRASSDIQQAGVNSELKKMAERYSIKVIDGASEMGIVRDLETSRGLGTSLKDGLHPNEKGQNLYARLVINAIKNNWLKLSLMNEM